MKKGDKVSFILDRDITMRVPGTSIMKTYEAGVYEGKIHGKSDGGYHIMSKGKLWFKYTNEITKL